MKLKTLSTFAKHNFQGRHYADRFTEPTGIEPQNKLKIPAQPREPASADTPVRLLDTCVCLLSASIASPKVPLPGSRRQLWTSAGRWTVGSRHRVTYGVCPNPCRDGVRSGWLAASRRHDCGPPPALPYYYFQFLYAPRLTLFTARVITCRANPRRSNINF
ncbi:unnamed protein product [Pieris macdunnoughi]|uniref:Uncharacterized protein n=1 Tax=Pieris macdunnoughi TaxID=345717 RepID=A0A821N0C5_9NEOP|nr:unnamed protein product [Pieris macdunnoughi]